MNVIKVTIVILAVGILGGCGFTPEGQAVRMAVSEFGAKAADAELENVEFFLCRGVSIGAWSRRYGVSSRKAEAWRTICTQDVTTP